jgi:hypothetical protein
MYADRGTGRLYDNNISYFSGVDKGRSSAIQIRRKEGLGYNGGST